MTQSRPEGARAVGELTPNRYSALPAGVAAGAVVAYVGMAEEIPLGPEGADGDGD